MTDEGWVLWPVCLPLFVQYQHGFSVTETSLCQPAYLYGTNSSCVTPHVTNPAPCAVVPNSLPMRIFCTWPDLPPAFSLVLWDFLSSQMHPSNKQLIPILHFFGWSSSSRSSSHRFLFISSLQWHFPLFSYFPPWVWGRFTGLCPIPPPHFYSVF